MEKCYPMITTEKKKKRKETGWTQVEKILARG